MSTTRPKYRGANVTIRMRDSREQLVRYMSFADEAFEGEDAFGVPDADIFYYTTLAELSTRISLGEFEVVKYTLVRL